MPLMLLGGINRLETMEQAMADGFDLVAMGRAVLREPDLVNRLQAGAATRGSAPTATAACRPSTPAPGAWSGRPARSSRSPEHGESRVPSTVESARSTGSSRPVRSQKLEPVLVSTPCRRSSPRSRSVSSSGPPGPSGRHAIAGVDAHPDLELVGVWTSTAAKHGVDAGELAELGRELGVKATTDRDELVALRPDCIVHGAMTDDRVFESIEDLTGFIRDGVNVVSSGPVILLHRTGTLPDEMIATIDEAGRRGQRQPARQRHRPGLRQRRAAAGDDQPQPADRPHQGQRDRGLLDLLPARRHEGPVRLRPADGLQAHCSGSPAS